MFVCICVRCVYGGGYATATMAAVGKVTETIQEVMVEDDGTYSADDKWDVLIQGPSSEILEVSTCLKIPNAEMSTLHATVSSRRVSECIPRVFRGSKVLRRLCHPRVGKP